MILTALSEVLIAGARLGAACPVIGVSARTIQRWKRHPDGDDQRCGPRHRPGNAFSAREETRGLTLLTSAEYGHLSPNNWCRGWPTQGSILRRNRPCIGYDAGSD